MGDVRTRGDVDRVESGIDSSVRRRRAASAGWVRERQAPNPAMPRLIAPHAALCWPNARGPGREDVTAARPPTTTLDAPRNASVRVSEAATSGPGSTGPAGDAAGVGSVIVVVIALVPPVGGLNLGAMRPDRCSAKPHPGCDDGPVTTDPTDPLHRFGEVRRELEARWPESQISPTLDRIRTLTQFLGDPQRAYPVIHVTGTNGKTSTARMIESLLRAFGLHTGLITSPHLSDLRERIRLDGEPISIDAFLDIYDEVAPVLAMADEASELEGGPRLSFFEVMTGLAFAAFADAPVDVAIVEVGMGGTWDATNVADGQVAVIMPIGMDHSDYLGDTLADIAGEKAGIIKPTSSVVLAAQEDQAMEVLAAASSQMEAPTAVEGIHFGVLERLVAVGGQQLTLRGMGADYEEVFLPLFGAHQARNAVAALAAVESFFGITSTASAPRSPEVEPGSNVRPIDIRDGARQRASPPTSPCPRPAGAWTPWWCVRVSQR